ncbi:ZAR1-like protein [Microtus ochrogaster]|uniref:ZAR1-like protein n=1 Tax=Microtus ochrogaster TaxID=79684 RepID=A0A8J6KLI9_MICOH|nr:ZAR1-like protein [Microtus ochrogaster]
MVQCSLGPQTLHSSSLWKPTEVFLRALIQLPKDEKGRGSQELTGPPEASQLLPLTLRSDSGKQEKLPQMKEDQEKDAPGSQNKKTTCLGTKYSYFHCKDRNQIGECFYVGHLWHR